MSLRSASLAALLVCAACGPRGSQVDASEQTASDTWTLTAIESLGERAAYVVVVDVARWPALRRQLAALALPIPDAHGLAAADTPGPWLAAALAAVGVTRTDAAPADSFAGLDPDRPLVLALAEPPSDGPIRSFAAGLPLITGELPGLRHELVLPATDVALLHRSLAAFLDPLGASRPELVAGQTNASAWQVGDASVALLSGDDQVRVIAVTHALQVEASSPPRPALLRAPAEPPLRTAGVVAAAMNDAPLSVLVRAQAQARLALWQIAREGLVDAELRLPVRPGQRAAIARALRCETLLQGSGREFEDWTIGLMADDTSLGLRVVASLGDAGVELFNAGAPAGAGREPLPGDLLAHAWLRLALDAMLAAVDGSSSPLSSPANIEQFAASCGEHLPALLAPAPFSHLQHRPELAPLLARDLLQVDLQRSGRALIGRLPLGAAAHAAAPLDLSHVTWSERHVTPPPGEACGVQAALEAADQIGDPAALGAAASDGLIRPMAGLGGAAALDAIEAALRCPEAPPAATTTNLRRLSALALAGGLVDGWRVDEAARLLDRACEATRDEQLCRDAPAVRAMVAPHIPEVYVLCDDLVRIDHAHRVDVAPAGLALDGRRIADLPALHQALVALVAASSGGIYVDLGVDKHMRFGELRPLLTALATIKGLSLAVAMRGELSDHGAAARLPVAGLELGGMARPDEPERSLRDQAGTLVFAVEGEAIRIRTGMINLGVNPRPSPGALHFATLTRVSNGEQPLVHVTEESAWATVAIALAASCTGARLVEPGREQQLLGPAWRDADCLAVYHGPKPLSVVPGHRGPNNINSALIGVRPQLEACYAAGLIDDPKLAGRVVATYRVSAEGLVSEAAVTSKALQSPAVQQCMADAIFSASHSSADGPVVVRYAFDFTTTRR